MHSGAFVMVRVSLHYLAAFVVLTLYGGQVCPFVEALPLHHWAFSTAIVFTGAFLVQLKADKGCCESTELSGRAKKTFLITMTIFLSSGLIIGVFNYIQHDFPTTSGFKLIVGWFMIGFFLSLDLALERRKDIMNFLASTGQELDIKKSYASLTRLFIFFATFGIISILGVSYLVIIKDLDWLFATETTRTIATISILKEFAFIFGVILVYTLIIIISFSKNLKLYLKYQNNTLQEVVNGNLNAKVPVSSVDEFGLMATYTNEMIKSLKSQTEMVQLTQDVAILSLASLAETRDNETGAHIMRTQKYVLALANALKNEENFKEELTEKNIDLMYKSAPLHDIGKVGIPDNILLKPAKLTDDEFKIMKRHPNYGKKALEKAAGVLGTNSFLNYAEEIAFTHHEKWNGSGYPRKLKGEEIPVSGRLMAVADVYDALISKRIYKEAFSHDKAKEIIVNESGKHFDPKVIEAFIKIENEFVRIAEEHSDKSY